MNGAVAALALGAVLVAAGCAAPVASPSAPTTRVGGPGWSLELPMALGLVPGPMAATDQTGTWETVTDGERTREISVLVNRESAAPLDDHFGAVELAPGSRIQEQAPVQVPRGRAMYYRVANADLPPHDLVLVEPEPGTIVSIVGTGIAADALAAIARTLVVEDR